MGGKVSVSVNINLFGLVQIGGSLTISTLTAASKGITIQTGKGKILHFELEDGKKWSVHSRYVLVHADPSLIGKAFAFEGVRTGIIDPLTNSSVTFQLCEDDAEEQATWAVNTSTDTDYLLTFANTGGSGSITPCTQVFLPRATEENQPYWLDVSPEFAANLEGNIAIVPTVAPASQEVQKIIAKMKKMGLKFDDSFDDPDPTLPTTSIIGLFRSTNVVASAVYTINSQITFGWTIDSDTFEINGAVVNYTGTSPINVQIVFYWINPMHTFQLNFPVTGSGETVYNFPIPNNAPISYVDISITQETQPGKAPEIFKEIMEHQIATGKAKKVKYTYL